MIIYVLVTAHTNAKLLRALVQSLRHDRIRVVIHIDAKSSEGEFASLLPLANFVPSDSRIRVTWGTWTQVRATVALLDCVVEQLEDGDRVIFVSGDSFPTMPAESLLEFFEDNRVTEFMNMVPMPSPAASKPLERVTRLHLPLNRRIPPQKALIGGFKALRLPHNAARVFGERKLFAGSNWWALTGEAVHWMRAELRQHPELLAYCRWVAFPDEFLFQTLIGNSRWAKRLQPGIMYTKFADAKASGASELRYQDYLELLDKRLYFESDAYGASTALFVRKVDFETAARIRDHWRGCA